jgi:hypothetical protein
MFLFAENDGGGVAICLIHEMCVFLQQASVLSVFRLLISIKARLYVDFLLTWGQVGPVIHLKCDVFFFHSSVYIDL